MGSLAHSGTDAPLESMGDELGRPEDIHPRNLSE